MVDQSIFDSTVAYLENFTLAPTDSFYDEDTGKDTMAFINIDEGEELIYKSLDDLECSCKSGCHSLVPVVCFVVE